MFFRALCYRFLTFCLAHTTLELFGCIMITVRSSLDLAGVFRHYNDSGPAAMALCILIDGATLITVGINGGTASVVIHTLDRYWKLVHAVHHRNYYKRWMLYVGLLLPWLNGVAIHLLPAIGTSRIVNENCHPTAFWPSLYMEKVCSSWCRSIVYYVCEQETYRKQIGNVQLLRNRTNTRT